jgi:hypothetical protein
MRWWRGVVVQVGSCAWQPPATDEESSSWCGLQVSRRSLACALVPPLCGIDVDIHNGWSNARGR